MKRFRFILALVLFGCACVVVRAEVPETAHPFFQQQVEPFFGQYCVGCHGEQKQKAKFFLHDMDGSITGGKDTVRWEKILEMLSLGDMPPEDEKQPTKAERKRITDWVTTELHKIGRGPHAGTRALPHQANRVDHQELFSGEHTGPAYSPARLWRKSPQIYRRFADEMRTNVSQPLLGLGGKGIQDYASLLADEATIKTMMRNSNLIAEMMVAPERTHQNRRLHGFFKQGASEPEEADIQEAIGHLFQDIFQRQPMAEDRQRYIDGLFSKNRELGGLKLGFRSLIVGMLMSQEFVFRLELGLGEELPDGRRMLSPHELAYVLSFALYDRPDPSLIQAANDGKLVTREDVARELQRILDTEDQEKRYWNYPMYHRWGSDYYHHRPRVLRFFQEFFGYTAVEDVFKDKERNGQHHANRLRKDADMFVLHVLENDRNVLAELLTTSHYPMDHITDARLKRLFDENNGQYRGVRAKYGAEFEQIKKSGLWPGVDSRHVTAYNLDEDKARSVRRGPGEPVSLPGDERAGMLTHPAWLVAHSGNFENDPIRRGKWIREHLLADLVPDIPIGVDAKVPEDPHRTLRERMEFVRAEECWRCHKQMNPLGEAFEHYDDFGRYRDQIVLGDADAFFAAKRKYEGQKKNWQKELKEWRGFDATGRAAKVAHAEQMLAGLKEPDEDVENYTAALRGYENTLKRWTKERDHWSKVDDAEQQRRIDGIENNLAKLVAPIPEAKPVDATGELIGTGDPNLDGPVNNAVDLSRRLAKSELARQSFVRHAFRYWMGRNEMLHDSPTLIAADRAYVENEGSFKAMLVSLLTSDSFLYRK